MTRVLSGLGKVSQLAPGNIKIKNKRGISKGGGPSKETWSPRLRPLGTNFLIRLLYMYRCDRSSMKRRKNYTNSNYLRSPGTVRTELNRPDSLFARYLYIIYV